MYYAKAKRIIIASFPAFKKQQMEKECGNDKIRNGNNKEFIA